MGKGECVFACAVGDWSGPARTMPTLLISAFPLIVYAT